MELICNHQKLLTAIRNTERVVGRNISLPILGTILLNAQRGHLQISATNLEVGIKIKVPAKIDTEGSLAVPARVISEFIGAINDEKIKLKADKNSLHITSENYKTQILGLKPDDFPIIPMIRDGQETKLEPAVLKRALSAVVDSAATSETRPELSGVYCAVGPQSIEVAATDSFRLSEYRGGVISSSAGATFILPRFSSAEIIRLLDFESQPISLVTSDNQCVVRGQDLEFVSRLIDGHYPDYKRVIPEKAQATAVVSRPEFERAIRIASVFTSAISDIKIKASGDKLALLSRNSERGETNAHLPAKIGGQFELAVNYRYLLDGLKILEGDKIVLGFCGAGAPLLVKAEGNDYQTYVIMPLRN